MPDPTCVTPECDRPRAHGNYCGPCRHLRRNPDRVSVWLTCRICESRFDWTGKTGPRPRFCSDDCRAGRTTRRCAFCRSPFAPSKSSQKFCRPACRNVAHKSPARPATRECSQCGDEIDLLERMADGRLKWPANTKRCAHCQAKARPHRYGMTAAQLADRDGCECRWCGLLVDLKLIGSRSQMAPSVDHIIPWSLGGSNDPTNLQLMHRKCNSQKGVRVT